MQIYNNTHVGVIIEHKLDGIMVNVIYHNGKLQSVVTRGDCYGGEDIIDVLKHILPENIIQYDPIEIRGEICISKSNYNQYFSEYSSPRHAIISIIGRKNCNIITIKKLEFYAYDFGVLSKNIFSFSQYQTYMYLNALSIKTICYKRTHLYKLEKDFEKFSSLDCDYPIDGYVFKIESVKLQLEKFDSYSKESSYCFAYKQIEKFKTQIESISFNFNKSGICVPIAKLKTPIKHNNIVCNKINLYSHNFVNSNNITTSAEIDVLYNAIFVFHSVIKALGKPVIFPTNCIFCNSELQITGMHLACLNVNCYNKLVNTIAIICKQIGIKTIAKKTIQTLVKNNIIKNIISVFELEKQRDKIMLISGFQSLKIDNFINSINKFLEKFTLEHAIICFGIQSIGINTANAIAKSININKKNIDFNKIKDLTCLNTKQKHETKLFFENNENLCIAQKIITTYLNCQSQTKV